MISLQIKNNLREAPCDYREEGDTYTSKKDGKLWPGTTTIVSLLDKPFLVSWAAKEVWKALTGKYKQVAAMQEDVYEAFILEAKMAYRRKATEAKDSGTLAHDFIEKWIDSKIIGGGFAEELHDPKALNAVEEFKKWEIAHQITWLASELVVGSQVHEFGGKLDALAIVDGVPSIIDFKTSNQISKDYFLQTAAYEIALEEMGIKVWQRVILRIPKDGSVFEALVVPTPLDLDRQTFLSLRQIQRWVSYVGNEKNEVIDTAGKVKPSEVGTKVEVPICGIVKDEKVIFTKVKKLRLRKGVRRVSQSKKIKITV